MASPVKLIIFDIDGTLIDSAALLLAAQYATFERHGLAHPGDEAGLGIVGLSLEEAFLSLVGPDCAAAELAQTYKDQFGVLRQRPELEDKLYPGIADVVLTLRARKDVRLGIATGKSMRGVSHLLDRHGWHDLFDIIRTADDCPSKPHPAMLLESMQAMGVGPEATMMIGDANFDMAMARSAGCHALGVAWGFQSVAALEQAGAHAIAEQVADIPLHIAQMLAIKQGAA
jgi:phosphoglycolate phosphatase